MNRNWTVLLIGGASGTGKTSVSYRLASRYGVGITEVDDFQIALATMTTPEQYPALHYWRTHPESVDDTAADVVDQLRRVGETLSVAIAAVIREHVRTNTPVILEGDFILPSLMSPDGANADVVSSGFLRAVFIDEPDKDQLRANFQMREPEADGHERRAEVSLLYGSWLAGEAIVNRIPVIPARPWSTVLERVVAALD